MNEIRLQPEYDAYYPGTDLKVTVHWDFEDTPPALVARLLWNTEGKGTQDIGLVSTKRITPVKARDSETLKFRLPWGPYSFSGKLISIIWAIDVTAESGGETVRAEFVMGPNASEVLAATSKED